MITFIQSFIWLFGYMVHTNATISHDVCSSLELGSGVFCLSTIYDSSPYTPPESDNPTEFERCNSSTQQHKIMYK